MTQLAQPPQATRNLFDLLSQPQALQCLPSLRVILRELEEKTSYQQVAIQEISKVIRNDQSLTVRIIRLANSGYFSLGQPILDLDEAILYLGLNNVRTIVFTSRCIETTSALRAAGFSWTDFWKHSAAVAAMTRALGGHVRRELSPLPAESYYLAGLMHDIGKLVLALVVPKEFERALKLAAERKSPLHTVETELLGADHAQLGAWYLQRQGVPPALIEAVRLHHAWRLDGSRSRNAFIVNFADRIVRHCKVGLSGSAEDPGQNPLDDPLFGEFVTKLWDQPESLEAARKTVEKEVAVLPELVQSITA